MNRSGRLYSIKKAVERVNILRAGLEKVRHELNPKELVRAQRRIQYHQEAAARAIVDLGHLLNADLEFVQEQLQALKTLEESLHD